MQENGLNRKWLTQGTLALAGLMLMLIAPVQALALTQEERLALLEERYKTQEDAFAWMKNFKPLGDLRLRHEQLIRDGDNGTARVFSRTRHRIRFRLGGEYFFDPNLKVGFRLVTGGDDPISTNQTLDDGFDTKGFNFDRGYADWKYRQMQLRGGKFGVPFMKSEMLWDGDLSVEGATEKFWHKLGNGKIELILGQFAVEELSDTATSASGGREDDPNLMAYQAIVSQKLGEIGEAKVAVGYFDYNALAGNILPFATKGNTLDAAGNYITNYDLFNVMAAFKTDMIFGIPVTLYGEYVKNVADRADKLENMGWHLGTKIGKKVKKFGDWQLKYLYREVERDAVLDAVSDSDFHEAGTNAKGSEMAAEFGIYDGVLASVTYWVTNEITGPKDHLERLQLDLIFTLF